jgi:hypothetical protein
MHYLLAGSRTGLTYLQDRRALAGIDWPAVLKDLIDAGAPPESCRWRDLDGLTHVVLAVDPLTRRYTGLLGLIERVTPPDRWLMVEAAMVRPGETGVMLRRAMLAHILARIVCLDGKPAALVAPWSDRSSEPALRDLGLNIRFSALHPPADGNVIAFDSACLSRQIGVASTLLDLRRVTEKSLLADLRAIHDGQPKRLKAKAKPARRPMAKPAKPGGATHRPRKTTRTGRIG